MNKLLLLPLLLICTVEPAKIYAQDAEKDSPLEKARTALSSGKIKLAKTAPTPSAWTRTLSPTSGPLEGLPVTISGLRVGDIKQEVRFYANAAQAQVFELKDIYIFQTPGSRIQVAEKQSMMAETQEIFADFPGAGWAAPANLVAVEKRGGQTLWKFASTMKVGALLTPEETALGTTPAMMDAPIVVWFDATTGLPSEVQLPTHKERYQFTTPPTVAPVLPQDFRTALEAHIRTMEKMNKRLNTN
jgi:hypothetical protein